MSEPPDDADAPLLPASSSENDLREAVGVDPVREPHVYGNPAPPPIETPALEYPLYSQAPSYETPAAPPPPEPTRAEKRAEKKRLRDADDDRDDDEPATPKNRKGMIIGAIALLVGIGITALILLGAANSDKFALVCEPEQAIAQQGRSFPPWGMKELGGAEWKPIALPPQVECKSREAADVDQLSGMFLDLLVDQASTLLTAREVTKVDLAEAELKQGLLLARNPNKRDQRKELERMLGDVDYWRALGALRDATAKLGDAAKQFDAAAAQRPRHVSDASAWASYIRKVADELKIGPAGSHTAVVPSAPSGIPVERPNAPSGVALPVEPPTENAAPPVIAPDAGVPSGGVLL